MAFLLIGVEIIEELIAESALEALATDVAESAIAEVAPVTTETLFSATEASTEEAFIETEIEQGTTNLIEEQLAVSEEITQPTLPTYLEEVSITEQTPFLGDQSAIINVSGLEEDTASWALRDVFALSVETVGGVAGELAPALGSLLPKTKEELQKVLLEKIGLDNVSPSDIIERFFPSQTPAINSGEFISFSNGSFLDPRALGYDVGCFISYTQQKLENNGGNEYLAMFDVSKEHPNLAYLFKPLYEFERDVKDKPKLNINIFSVFDGTNIRPENVITDPISGRFSIIDETGVKREYTGSMGNIPAYDTFCGPSSPNNTAPLTIFGTICMLHDIDYDNEGYFSWQADQKMISRVAHLKHLMGYTESALATLASKYFSTVGYTLAMFKGTLGTSPDKKVYDLPAGDIFFHLTKSENVFARKKFYEGMVQALESSLMQSKSMDSISCRMNESNLLQMFDALNIVSD